MIQDWVLEKLKDLARATGTAVRNLKYFGNKEKSAYNMKRLVWKYCSKEKQISVDKPTMKYFNKTSNNS